MNRGQAASVLALLVVAAVLFAVANARSSRCVDAGGTYLRAEWTCIAVRTIRL